MAVNSYKMGPGTLTLGAAGSLMTASAQVTNCRITPTESVTEGDKLDVLSGEVLQDTDDVTYTYVLQGTIVQDIGAAGISTWTWTNKGTTQVFTFIPNTVTARKVTGSVRIVPLEIGGDAKKRPTSDFAFAVVGADPILAAAP